MAVLFSGGLDSMILAALLNECLNTKCRYYAQFFFFFKQNIESSITF